MPLKNENLLYLVVAGICAGSASILIRFAGDVNYLEVSFYRLFIATIAVYLAGSVLGRIRLQHGRDGLLMVLAGVFLGLHFIAFTFAVQTTTVSNATFLTLLAPIFVAVIAPFVVRERTTAREVGFIAVAVLGSLLAGSRNELSLLPAFSIGDITAVIAAFLAADYTIMGRLLRTRVEWFTYIEGVYLTATIVAGTVSLATLGGGFIIVPQSSVPALLGVGLVPTFGGHSLYNLALGRVKAIRANFVLLLEPVIATVLAYLLFKEAPTYLQVVGYSLIAASIVGVAKQITTGDYAKSK